MNPAANDMPVLQMAGITKRFPGVVALDSVDLEIAPGEVLALIGENGAGKSTLMKVLGGVHQPDGGTVRVQGEVVAIRSVSDADRLGVGFVHQELNVLDNLDVAGNIFLGREPRRRRFLVDRDRIAADAQPLLDMLGLKVSPDTLLAGLSLGQQQMVEIAKALSKDARVIIMDEPTSSLTLSETEKLLEVIAQLKARGIAVIYISHRLGEVSECADRVIALRDGQNAGGLSKDEIDHDAMVALMVGRELGDFYDRVETEKVRGRFKVAELETAAYPGRPVSFEVAGGEILGFAGLVGSGRSEVVQAIFGVDRALAGRMELDGEAVALNSTRAAIGRGIYLAPEDRKRAGVILEFSIEHNISLAGLQTFATRGLVDRFSERVVADQQMGDLGIKAPNAESAVGNLSGGNQQKVVLAKWLSMEPKVLIFDEPTRGIDVGAKGEIYKLMHQLAAEGVAIIMVSSDMEEVLGVSDRIAVMHEGQISGFLSREDFSEEAVMRLAVGGDSARQVS
ncbi:MAG: ribose transport system ATP-binding protein [Pseudoalteromonas tetraodonis]|jgi:ribose transport system ATP-binding protein